MKWPRRPSDGRQEGVVKDGGNSQHTLVYNTEVGKRRHVNAWIILLTFLSLPRFPLSGVRCCPQLFHRLI